MRSFTPRDFANLDNDPYETFQISRNASQAEIKAKYRKFTLDNQAFVQDKDEKAKQRQIKINAAYEVIGDKNNRAAYDKWAAENQPKASAHTAPPPSEDTPVFTIKDLQNFAATNLRKKDPQERSAGYVFIAENLWANSAFIQPMLPSLLDAILQDGGGKFTSSFDDWVRSNAHLLRSQTVVDFCKNIDAQDGKIAVDEKIPFGDRFMQHGKFLLDCARAEPNLADIIIPYLMHHIVRAPNDRFALQVAGSGLLHSHHINEFIRQTSCYPDSQHHVKAAHFLIIASNNNPNFVTAVMPRVLDAARYCNFAWPEARKWIDQNAAQILPGNLRDQAQAIEQSDPDTEFSSVRASGYAFLARLVTVNPNLGPTLMPHALRAVLRDGQIGSQGLADWAIRNRELITPNMLVELERRLPPVRIRAIMDTRGKDLLDFIRDVKRQLDDQGHNGQGQTRRGTLTPI